MKFMVRMGILFYVTVMLFLGCFLLLFVLNAVPLKDMTVLLQIVYYDPESRLIFGAISLLILIMNYVYARAISGYQQRETTIAFDNPAGRVTVSLAALEDLVRRVIARSSEIKDVRTSIRAGKRGLEVDARLILNADVNIPETTSHLQEVVRQKIQDTIGIDETVTVRINVSKIIAGASKHKRQKESREKDEMSGPQVPFQGYRA